MAIALQVTNPLHWKDQITDKQTRQKAAIPNEWLISPGAEHKLNVMDVPETCGLLKQRELEITSIANVATLLRKLANAEWSALEVITAFYKRAIIAHQLVGPTRILCVRLPADGMSRRSTVSQKSSSTRLFSGLPNSTLI